MGHVAIPDALKLVLDHLTAVRELDRYFRKKAVFDDLERYLKDVIDPAIQDRLPSLKSWACEFDENTVEYYPETWKPSNDFHVSLYLILPSPVDPDPEDHLPSVNLWVPTDWPCYTLFRNSPSAWVKSLKGGGFGHISEHKKWEEEFLLAKNVHWLTVDGSFDESDFLDRIVLEFDKIVKLELEISQTILEVAAQSPKKKVAERTRSKRSRRKS